MWHAIYTTHSKEMAVAEYLSLGGVAALCPVMRERVRSKVRGTNSYVIQEVIAPIFQHYIFAEATSALYLLARDPPDRLGMFRILRCGQDYAVLEDELIESLREIGETVVRKDLSHLKLGTNVALGTLAGLVATITRVTDILSRQEISVRFKMLGRWKEIAVPALSVEPV